MTYYPDLSILDVFPGSCVFGHISWGCVMDMACMDMFTGKFRLGHSARSYFMGKKIWIYFPDINFLDMFPDINIFDIIS